MAGPWFISSEPRPGREVGMPEDREFGEACQFYPVRFQQREVTGQEAGDGTRS
jgi:hypothetical protein